MISPDRLCRSRTLLWRCLASRAATGGAVLTLAIQPDDRLLMSGRRQSFSRRWAERAGSAGFAIREVDVYQRHLPTQFDGCDGFLWWFAHLPETRESAQRIVQAVAHGQKIRTFPNWNTVWHFDDKVAQVYLLDAAGIPQPPPPIVFWNQRKALAFARDATYPLVLKLAGGIGSENVRKVASADEAMFWIGRLFGPGLSSLTGWPRPSAARVFRSRCWRRCKGAGGPAELGDQQALGAAARLPAVPGIHEWERFRYTCDGHRRSRLRLPPLQPSPGFPRLGQRRDRVGSCGNPSTRRGARLQGCQPPRGRSHWRSTC